METSGGGISRLDCYEDMFKEITRKLYGEDPDHRTSSVQNEFETSVSYKNDEDTGNGTDGSDDGNWTCEDEPLKGTDGSRIAAYHAGKATWRCYECGDITGGGPREAAEHFMELHSSRIMSDDSRNRHHSPRKDYLQSDLKIEELIAYLERLRERAERAAPPSRRTQETQTVPAALLPMASTTFLLQELPSVPAQQHIHQNANAIAGTSAAPTGPKRYNCMYCPYGTDRRDLFTRHENIHREEKPFHCYVCYKVFNRADHVKKHFLRMHRDHPYELSRIRKPPGAKLPQESASTSVAATATAVAANPNNQTAQQQQQQQPHASYQSNFAVNKSYQLQPSASTSTATGTAGIYQATMPAPGNLQSDAANCTTSRGRTQNGGCNSKSHLKGSSKSTQERRYTCCYCPWTGVDNWCLKRHMNTHLKPFACTLCEYKAARAERLATHVLKVHNRRQCSRCTFLAEDVGQLQIHQLQMHRVSSASAPTTSAAQAAPPPSNRHQQPIHPAGGGRPPPGPPVFPAPAPAIAPTSIPPSTILGHEMVKSPATAATMAYPTEEEKRSYRYIAGIYGDDDDGDGNNDDDDDNDGVVRGNGNREKLGRDFGACHVCSFKSDRDDNFETCDDNENSTIGVTNHSVSNGDFICSRRQVLLPSLDWNRAVLEIQREVYLRAIAGFMKQGQGQKRSRKQSQPRKAKYNVETENQDPSAMNKSSDSVINQLRKISNRARETRNRSKRPMLYRCRLCPKHALARSSQQPYHTRASLTLHKLWWHKRKYQCLKLSRKNIPLGRSAPSPVSSITLKATFFTNPNYRIDYHR